MIPKVKSLASGAATGVVFLLVARFTIATQRRAVRATVGMPARIDQLVLPGAELEATPLVDRRQPIVVRLTDARPHGTARRYDLEFTGLAPGRYDLRNYLRRKDGSTTDDLPTIPVEIVSVLAAGEIEPHALPRRSASWLRGYRLALALGGIVWLGGLLWLFLGGRKKPPEQEAAEKPITLAGRLRPLVEEARSGTLDGAGQAELERLLLAFWRRRLQLENLETAEAIAALRRHEEAGALLRQLEAWLHAPGEKTAVDVNELLAPYCLLDERSLEERSLEESPPPAVGATP